MKISLLTLLLCMAAATTVRAQNAKTASLRAWEEHVAAPFRPILVSSKLRYLHSQVFVKQFPTGDPVARAGPGQEALEALERLQIKCNTGITYHDYLRTLGETAFTVERFIGNHSADVHPVLLFWMKDALDKEEFAAKIWHWKIQAGTDVIEASDSDVTFLNLMAAHPECKMFFRGGSTTYGRVIRYFWNGAAEDINLANSLLGQKWPILPAGTINGD